MPPNGTSGRIVPCWLIQTVPASSRGARSRARSRSELQIEAPKPKGLAFAATLNAPIPERAQFGLFRM